MPKKYVVFFKSVGKKWFILLLILIIVVFIYDQTAAIWLTGITLILFIISSIPSMFFKFKLLRFMKGFFMIEDDTIAKELKRPLREIRESMFEIYQNQTEKGNKKSLGRKKKWLIVFLNKRYIFYHAETIQKFLELHDKGKNEKEILDSLVKGNHDIRTRAEVKAIKDVLIKIKRI